MGLQSRLDGFVRQRQGEGASTSGSSEGGWRKTQGRAGLQGRQGACKGLTSCPICSRNVPHVLINEHLDICTASVSDDGAAALRQVDVPQCASHSPHAGSNLDLHNVDDDENNHGLGTAASATRKRHRRESEGETPVNWTDTIVPNRYPSLEGHFVLEEFVSEAEEAALLEALDGDTANPWRHDTFNGHSEGKKYGVLCDLYRRVVLPPVHAMPPWLEFVTARMRATKPPPWLMPHHAWPLKKFAPNECNAIDYRRATGCSLEPHCDDRHMSGDVICNLSLAGDATMTYEREKGSTHSVRVELPRRSLQVQANGVRYNYTHGIANDDLHSARRVSITFRETFATKETAEVQDVRASWKTKGARR